MENPQYQLVRISKAASGAGVSTQSLQYYLMLGLLEPTEYTSSGQQLFNDEAIKRIKLIKQLNSTGYPLREIREIFLQRNGESSEDNNS